jgi:hypothetical protein
VRVYLAATVALASALRNGLSDWRISQLTDWIDVPKRTLERWPRVVGAASLTPVLGDGARPVHAYHPGTLVVETEFETENRLCDGD